MKNEVKTLQVPTWLKWTLGIFYALAFLLGGPLLWAIVGFLTMSAWGVLLSWRGIPKDCYTYLKTNGTRGDKLYGEGWYFIIPIVQEFDELIKYEMSDTFVSVWLTCKDKIKVLVEASIEWWPNRDKLKDFFRVASAIIKGALVDDFKQALNEIAEAHNADVIMENKKVMGVIADCAFRLSVIPHDNPKKTLNDEMPNDPPIVGLTEDPILADGVIAFYQRPEIMARVLKKLAEESTRKNDESKTERDHFIDITDVSIAHWAYPESIEAANEKEREAREEAKAIDIKRKKLKEIRDELRGEDVDPKEAVLSSEVTAGLTKRTIDEKRYDVKGLQGVVNLNLGKAAKVLLDDDDKPEPKDDKKESN